MTDHPTAHERATERWHATCTRCRHGLIYDDARPLDVEFCTCHAGHRQAALSAWLDRVTS